jgi:hypothetical protein
MGGTLVEWQSAKSESAVVFFQLRLQLVTFTASRFEIKHEVFDIQS